MLNDIRYMPVVIFFLTRVFSRIPGSYSVLFALLTFSCFAEIRTANADARTVSVGVYQNAPKVFTDESGKPSGIFIEIIEHIAKIEDWNLRYVSGTWAEGLDRLAKGEIDLMPDVAYTSDREKLYSFHKIPVMSVWSQVYAPRGSGIQSILDLNGKRIAAMENTIQLETFTRLTNSFGLKITLIPVPDYKTEFEMIAAGKADAGLTNRLYGLMHARKSGLEDTPVMFDPAPFFFAATKTASGQLPEIIDRHLSELKKDPQSAYYTAMKRWTSEDVQFKMPAWLQISGLVLGIALLISLVGGGVLKHQVNARTKELKQINQEMEQRIDERTITLKETNLKLHAALEDLAVAKEHAEAADRIKSAFLATMSHELRTPLNSIIGFTGILLQQLGGPINEEQSKQLSMVRNSANHLLSLISDILDLSKIEAGQLSLNPETFELKDSISRVVQSMRPLAEKKGLDLTLEVTGDVGTACVDMRRMEQVLLNLLSNAVKFTEQGTIRVSCVREVDEYQICVTDTGIGIKDSDLERLFMPFHQIDNGLSRKYEGTGLGLSICKRLAELMGGEIGVRSEHGAGTTFWFTVPAGSCDDQPCNHDSTSVPVEKPAKTAAVEKCAAGPINITSPLQDPASIKVDRGRVEAVTSRLAGLLRGDDISAADYFDANRELLKEVFPQDIFSIEGAIRRFDFESALAELEIASEKTGYHG